MVGFKKTERIKRILSRNVVEVVERGHLEKKLISGKRLRIKLGIDPTGPNLHLGRAVSLWKLKEFQDLGHRIVLIIGDFTARVGDASDKESQRAVLSESEIKENMKTYKKQIGKILDVRKVEFRYNSEWLAKLNLGEIIKLASLFTVHQLIERRNFKERFKKGKVIGFQEFIYPLMQGYDSVAVSADVEIGGTDQLFNLMAGRKIQEFYQQEPQDIITLEMLEGLDGRKMSTSWGNVINIIDKPDDMFGKVMSMHDKMIVRYFKLATNLSDEEIKKIEKDLKRGKLSPYEAKQNLAFEIVKLYHGDQKAEFARRKFIKIFQKKQLPKDVLRVKVKQGSFLKDNLLNGGFVKSNSLFRRLIKEGAVEFNGKKVSDVWFKINKEGVVRIGKKKFVRFVVD